MYINQYSLKGILSFYKCPKLSFLIFQLFFIHLFQSMKDKPSSHVHGLSWHKAKLIGNKSAELHRDRKFQTNESLLYFLFQSKFIQMYKQLMLVFCFLWFAVFFIFSFFWPLCFRTWPCITNIKEKLTTDFGKNMFIGQHLWKMILDILTVGVYF